MVSTTSRAPGSESCRWTASGIPWGRAVRLRDFGRNRKNPEHVPVCVQTQTCIDSSLNVAIRAGEIGC